MKSELEKLIIRAAILENESVEQFIKRGIVSKHMESDNSELWDGIISLFEQKQPISELTLSMELGRQQELLPKLNAITAMDSKKLTKGKLVKFVLEEWRKKIIKGHFSEITENINNGKDCNSQIERLDSVKNDLNSLGYINTLPTIKKDSESVLENFNRLHNKQLEQNTLPFPEGIKIQPARKGNLIYVTALTGCGKSTFARQWSWELYQKGFKGMFFSMEMSQYEMIEAYAQHISGINPRTLWGSDPESHKKICKGVEQIKEAIETDLRLICGHKTRSEIQAEFLKTLFEFGSLDYVIIDYIQLIGSDKHEGETERIQNNSMFLRRLSLNYNITFIVLCQFNRAASQDGGKPQLHQMKGSSQLEQDANIAIIISPEDLEQRSQPELDVIIETAKRRDGWTGSGVYHFSKTRAIFEKCGY